MSFGHFSAFYGQCSVAEAWTNPSPWSIVLFLIIFKNIRCQSLHHNDDSETPTVFILSVRCDNRVECHKGVDEAGCQTKKDPKSRTEAPLVTGTSNTHNSHIWYRYFFFSRDHICHDWHFLGPRKSWSTCIFKTIEEDIEVISIEHNGINNIKSSVDKSN